jgi:serine protease Do
VKGELARSFGYSGTGGVLVQDVSPDGPAARAGVKAGDIITRRDGKTIPDVVAFRNAIAQTKPGTKVELTVFRGGKEQAFSVELDQLRAEGPDVAGPSGLAPSPTRGRYGMRLQDLDPELERRLEAHVERGAVITGLEPDSIAAQSGLEPGDVIVQVGRDAVRGAADALRFLSKVGAGKPVRLRVIREGHGLFVILPPSKPSS